MLKTNLQLNTFHFNHLSKIVFKILTLVKLLFCSAPKALICYDSLCVIIRLVLSEKVLKDNKITIMSNHS